MYNANNLDKPPKLRSIDKICREIDMYELIDKDGSYIAPNRIENTFGRLETYTGKVIELIKAKSQNEKCLNCPTILSENDKSYLIIFMTALKFRDPQTIDLGIKFLQQYNPNMDMREARNFTLMNLFPFGVDSKWDDNTVIKTAIKNYCGMAFQIGIADDDIIITSDRPVVEWSPDKNELYNRPKAVVFPLTSRLVLYLYPIENVEPIGRNCFIKLSNDQIDDIQTNVAVYAREWIYSRNPLTKEQLERVKDARNRLMQK